MLWKSGFKGSFACFCLTASLCVGGQQLGEEKLNGNEDKLAQKMAELIKQVSLKRAGDGKVKRFNQAKSLGCFNGKFTVNDALPDDLKVGLFARPASYKASFRFANASTLDDSEKDLRGLSIRVQNVPGDTLWGEQGLQDFVLNSYPVLFAGNPEDFMGFIRAQYEDSILSYFLNPFDSHLKALFILLKARDKPNSPFDIRFWSTTAFQLGSNDFAVKYSVSPCSSYQSPEPAEYTRNYLRAAMHEHLQHEPVCLDFMLQRQVDAESMPVEDTSQEWSEDESPFIAVARIQIQQQEFMTADALEKCETVTFNPWQSLEAHRPLGRMNYVRRLIYEELAAFRQKMNHSNN